MAEDAVTERPPPKFRHYVEYVPLWLATRLFGLLPLDAASTAAAALGRFLGPKVPVSNRARQNLRVVFPDMPEAEREKIVRGVWDNLFRIVNDFCHMPRIRAEHESRIEVVGGEHLEALRTSGRPAILFTAHIGDWEMASFVARTRGLPISFLYRRFNNPLFDRTARLLQDVAEEEIILKGRAGARKMTEVMKRGDPVFMLVDVRMNDGVKVPFLGVDAMTPSAPALLALRYDAVLVPIWTERTGPAQFRVTIEEPYAPPSTGDRNADVVSIMTWVNDRIGAWVRARPEQWMWLHRRWGKTPGKPS